MAIDYSLYLVTDRNLCGSQSLLSVVDEAVAGGVSCVQLREKDLDSRQFVEQAKALQKVLQPLCIPLIINDRVDVALASGAAGVHLGQSDMHIRDARPLLGDSVIIGISAESVEDAVAAEGDGADYIGISPVFSTSTKKDIAQPLGLAGVSRIRELVQIPLVGIGGISEHNAAEVIHHGADGVAVVSAIVSADSPTRASASILEQVKRGRGR